MLSYYLILLLVLPTLKIDKVLEESQLILKNYSIRKPQNFKKMSLTQQLKVSTHFYQRIQRFFGLNISRSNQPQSKKKKQ